MRTLLIVLLVAWAAIALIGFILEAVVWLAVIGIALFFLTVLYWVVKGKSAKRRRSAGTA